MAKNTGRRVILRRRQLPATEQIGNCPPDEPNANAYSPENRRYRPVEWTLLRHSDVGGNDEGYSGKYRGNPINQLADLLSQAATSRIRGRR
jgi:hypothetical protein